MIFKIRVFSVGVEKLSATPFLRANPIELWSTRFLSLGFLLDLLSCPQTASCLEVQSICTVVMQKSKEGSRTISEVCLNLKVGSYTGFHSTTNSWFGSYTGFHSTTNSWFGVHSFKETTTSNTFISKEILLDAHIALYHK